jgi:hypothetical protein
MRTTCCFIGLVLVFAATLGSAPYQQQPDPGALLRQYCLGCHNQQMKQRGNVPVALDTLDLANVGRERANLGNGGP